MSIFLPKQIIFYDLLKKVCKDLQAMAALYAEFAERFNDFENYARRAKEIEKQADHNAHVIIDHLNKTFITPIDREDIYELARELDDIVDLIENVIHNIYLYKITKKTTAIERFAPIISEAATFLYEMLDCLQKQKYTDRLIELKIKIHELEDRGDEIFSETISKLFEEETDAVTVIKHKDIIESLENVTDKFQYVSDIIEGIIVKTT
ncbi:DUF47 family protein [Candidatus Peregrinibacteria bacterium]|nr:DUF47 family protein [Candidatus Peregrinibacteria bacterium]